MNKKIIFELNTEEHFGPSCKFIELIKPYTKKGYQIHFWEKDWKKKSDKGLVYSKEKGEYLRSQTIFLYDASTHPDDYFHNLIY